MAVSPYTFDVTADNFRTLVLENSDKGPVLVNYWSPRAGPCMMLMPRLVRLCTEYGGRFLLAMLNTDQYGALARDQGVNSLPTVKMFRYGRVVDTLHGAESEPTLRKFIDKHVARPSDTVQRAALEAYKVGQIDQATSLAAEAALDDPENPRIPGNIAKLLMQQGRYRQAYDLLATLPPSAREEREIAVLFAHLGFILAAGDAPPLEVLEQTIKEHPNDVSARYQLSAVRLLADDYPRAMAELLEIVRRDRSFRDDAGRKGLLAIFGLLGEENQDVRRYRQLLQEALH